MTNLAVLAMSLLAAAPVQQAQMLNTGKKITPVGTHASVGSYPVNMVLTKDKKFAVVTTVGFRQFLSVVRTSDGKVVDQIGFNGKVGKEQDGLYYGLSWAPDGKLWVSQGCLDQVAPFRVSSSGKLSKAGEPIVNRPAAERDLPYSPAGLATSPDGKRLFVANNETSHIDNFKGSVSVMDLATGKETAKIATSAFPFALVLKTKGSGAGNKVYVASERDGVVETFDWRARSMPNPIKVGTAPTGLLFNKAETKLYVANAASDTVSVVDTRTDKVVDTIVLRPTAMPGLPGVSPTGLTLNADESRLYVACQDMNAVAVVSTASRKLLGYIPTGWLPTSVAVVGEKLLVTSAKGIRSKNPNGKPVAMPGMEGPTSQYIQDLIDGSVSLIKVPGPTQLKKFTAQVVANNRLHPNLTKSTHPDFRNPGIKHVIYIIKENRTYDNVLGDLPQGNGDPSITLFPRKVTPNQHAIAERFVLLDNFYVCAEVSQDGWVWSTAGMVSPYASRNTPYNYSGRGRNYDTEGSNNNIPVDLVGQKDVSTPAGGYIWDRCAASGVSYRNYGFFTTFADINDKRYDILSEGIKEGTPAKKALVGKTDLNYRRYDTQYADSDAYEKFGFSYPTQLKEFGENKAKSRFSAWKKEFDECVAKGEMPQFQMLRMGNDHTMGTRDGVPTPQSQVADNDYAVGQLVEAVSNSPFWKDTAIFVIEDDAQAGYDHVDAHRSTAYVISPFIKKATVDHTFYNTDSVLRTMELLLGMPPMSQYDAVATPFRFFGTGATNTEPYNAILPAQEILCALNKKTAYRAKDSMLIKRFAEESKVDEDLNDILWGAVMGADTARPKVRNGLTTGQRRDVD